MQYRCDTKMTKSLSIRDQISHALAPGCTRRQAELIYSGTSLPYRLQVRPATTALLHTMSFTTIKATIAMRIAVSRGITPGNQRPDTICLRSMGRIITQRLSATGTREGSLASEQKCSLCRPGPLPAVPIRAGDCFERYSSTFDQLY